jgi:hypothetical protein
VFMDHHATVGRGVVSPRVEGESSRDASGQPTSAVKLQPQSTSAIEAPMTNILQNLYEKVSSNASCHCIPAML